ncbi:beta-ketoacyl-[acyl-carrier-protein] synthase family protein [Lentibacillus jeotgali]|uniref:beta-ketoacyl-[acyl-carrier-protein] synthase family protein n=1 Tax=Lentibacillus jeotgali TaxID=558169 RepID=UPI0002627844|nr:beta-ketoacyl-[acyl-carrier-protein] synthase family protein [Lentibacillus jeotgali]
MNQSTIAVTGMGTVSPYGVGIPTFWENVTANRSAVDEIEDKQLRSYSPVGARVPNFDPLQFLPKKLTKNTDYFTQLSLIAAKEALTDAQLLNKDGETLVSGIDPDRVGSAIGTAFGGIQSLESGSKKLATGNSKRVGPRMISKAIPNAASSTISMQYGFHGPSVTYVTACAASANAIGESMFWFFRDDVDFVIAGGVDSLWSNVFLSGLRDAGALAVKGPDDPTTWSRPFDVNRTGMIMGEGSALFVLEPLKRAKARGAHIYATLKGYGASNDAHHDTAPDPKGYSAALAIKRALRSSQLTASDIDYVNAHATSTLAGDAAETTALQSIFGKKLDSIPVSSIKGGIGHLLGAAGAIESTACIKALESGIIPATLHCEKRDEKTPPDVVPNKSRKQRITTAMSNSFGFGGQNGILIWQAP